MSRALVFVEVRPLNSKKKKKKLTLGSCSSEQNMLLSRLRPPLKKITVRIARKSPEYN
jgi:hypothetical protein